MKSTYHIRLVTVIGSILILLGLLGMCKNEILDNDKITNQNEMMLGCGTVSRHNKNFNPSDSINLEIGKNVFRNNCATCHAKDMKTKATGPALSGVIKRFEYDTLKFANFVISHGKYLDTVKDEGVERIRIKYGISDKIIKSKITVNEIISVLEYIGN